METVEQFNENFNAKKPKKKGLMIGLIVAALAIVVAFVLVYFLVLTNPKFIFSKTIDKLFAVDSEQYDSIKMATEIKASVDLEDTTYQAELAEIEKFTFKAGVQKDAEEKQEIVNLGLEYDNQAVADAEVYYNDGEMYAYLEGLFDKYIEIDMDEETTAVLDEMFETVVSEENLKNSEKAVSIIREELKTQIKENGEFDKKKDKIEVGKDEIKVTKSTVTISEKQLYKIVGNMFSNLSKNDEFIDCFEGIEAYAGESVENILKEAADELKDIEGSSKNNVKISLYTKGFLNNNLVASTIEIYSEYNESTATIKIVKEDEGIYSYDIFEKSDKQKNEYLKGKVEIQKDKDTKKEQSGKLIITAEIIEIGSAKLEIDYLVEYNQGIDEINTSNSVNINDLTDTDMESIITELMDRPLIGDLIASEMGGFETGIDDEILTNPDTEINLENTITTTENEVKDMDAGYSVIYSVPVGFEYEADYSDDDIKFYDLEKDYSYIDATVSLDWYADDEYTEEINWDYEYWNESTDYKNVVLSEVKTINVGDKQFKYQTISYESNYGYGSESKYQDAYIWYPLGTEYLFTVELEATDTAITEDIIKGFLNINVTELN